MTTNDTHLHMTSPVPRGMVILFLKNKDRLDSASQTEKQITHLHVTSPIPRGMLILFLKNKGRLDSASQTCYYQTLQQE